MSGIMTATAFLLPDPRLDELARRFDLLLADLARSAATLLPPAELAAYESYDFPGRDRDRLPPEAWERRLRSIARGEEWLLARIDRRGCDRFVDLGCGLGTWSFLAALAGARRVTGIDLTPARLSAARLFAQEVYPRHGAGELDFRSGNLFDVTPAGPVNLFYLKSSLHHILPLDRLFDHLRERLAPGGAVVIHDENGACPAAWLKAWRARGLRTRETAPDPATGRPLPYAMEDYLTLPGILLRARRHGLRAVHRQAYLGFRGRADERWWRGVLVPLNGSLLLGTFLAPTFQVVLERA